MQELSKRYWRIKYTLEAFGVFYILLLLFIFLDSGLSKNLSVFLSGFFKNIFYAVIFYLLIIYLMYYILSFPLHFYQSYVLEKRFYLSQQSFLSWLKDGFKQMTILYIISLILIEFFYFSLNAFYKNWWLVVSIFWIFLSVVLTKILPVFIIPLFFRYRVINDEGLKRLIMDLADKMKIKILDIFEIDLSKKTLKANAAFVGLGKTKRVILADTLKEKYTPQEIEVVIAHEFAHYQMRHILKLLAIETVSIILNFYLIFKTADLFLKRYGFLSLGEIGSLPIVFIYLILWSILTTPFKNFISRTFEKNADILAVKVTKRKDAFVSLMEKLAQQNLSDRNPHPLIKFFFFDHPPIDARIKFIEKLELV